MAWFFKKKKNATEENIEENIEANIEENIGENIGGNIGGNAEKNTGANTEASGSAFHESAVAVTDDWNAEAGATESELSKEIFAERGVLTEQITLTEQGNAAGQETSPEQEASAEQETLPEQESSAGQEALPEQESSAGQETLPEQESSAGQETLQEQESSAEQETLPEQETSAKQETLPEQESSAKQETLDEEKAPEKKMGLFQRLKAGLTKTRNNIVAGLDSVFNGFSEIDDDFYDELEEILIMGDIGVHATENVLEALKKQVKENHIKKPDECKEFLVKTLKEQMQVGETAYEFEQEQSVVFVIGVNGVGKTTSIGKLASLLKGQGRKVLLAAADTFRAAAGDQLAEWSHRAGVEMIGGVEGADPASVLFDAVNAAKSRKADVLLCDTAGRLHNKKNLMDELKKMNRIIDREYPNAHRENLLVLDASTGQNALMQAKEFSEVTDLTGIILTKMDGTAKGGIAIAILSELGIPVKYIGVGEKIEDLQKFDADAFVDALFDVPSTNDMSQNLTE